jgi:hypothetical protein
MIRVSVTHQGNTICFKVEGRLAGYGVDELRGAILRRDHQCKFELDLADVESIDEDGERLLLWIDRIGGTFRTDGVYSNFLVERLGIRAPAAGTDEYSKLSA